MPDIQVRPDVSVQRLLGDMGHASLDPAIERQRQDVTRGPLSSLAAIGPSPHYSKAAASAYEPHEQGPMRVRVQDPVVAAAAAFFQAPKEAQREALHELWEIAKQLGPSTDFVNDFELGNYSLAFVGMVDFLLDIYPLAQIQKWIINLRSSLRLRKALKHEYHPDVPLEFGCLDYLLRSDVRSQINRLVKNPVRKAQFVGVVSRYVPRVGFVNESGELKVGLQLRAAHQLDTIAAPTVDAPVRIVQEGNAAWVLIHQGDMGSSVEAKIVAFEVPTVNLTMFARDLISDGFLKIE